MRLYEVFKCIFPLIKQKKYYIMPTPYSIQLNLSHIVIIKRIHDYATEIDYTIIIVLATDAFTRRLSGQLISNRPINRTRNANKH